MPDASGKFKGISVPSIPWSNQGWLTPQLPQRQDSLEDQLDDVRAMANKMGCYDAADWIDRTGLATNRPRHKK